MGVVDAGYGGEEEHTGRLISSESSKRRFNVQLWGGAAGPGGGPLNQLGLYLSNIQ